MLRVLFLITISLLWHGMASGVESTKPYGEKKVKLLVGLLAHDDYQQRKRAHQALIIATASSDIDLLKAAQKVSRDPEVNLRLKVILGELFWRTHPGFKDPALAFSASSVCTVSTPSFSNALRILKKESTVGKALYPKIKPALDDYFLRLKFDNPEGKYIFEHLCSNYGGPWGWRMNYSEEDGDQFGWIVGLQGESFEKDFQTYAKANKLPVASWRTKSGLRVRGRKNDAAALAGRVILHGEEFPVLLSMISTITNPTGPSFGTRPSYLKGYQQSGPGAIYHFHFDVQRALERNEGTEQWWESGFRSWLYSAVSLNVKDGLISERIYNQVNTKEEGIPKLLAFPTSRVDMLQYCPADSLLCVSLPLTGERFYQSLLHLAPLEIWPIDDVEKLKASHLKFEKESGIPVFTKYVKQINGESVFWVENSGVRLSDLKKGASISELYEGAAILSLDDEKAASSFSLGLKTLVCYLAEWDEVVLTETMLDKSYFRINKKLLSQETPYPFCWLANGAKLVFATSPKMLNKVLKTMSKEPSKETGEGHRSITSIPNFQRVLNAIPETERGALCYINSAEIASRFYKDLLKQMLQATPVDSKNAGYRFLKRLPSDIQGEAQNLPGTLISCVRTKEGFLWQSVGDIPPVTTVPAYISLAFAYMFSP